MSNKITNYRRRTKRYPPVNGHAAAYCPAAIGGVLFVCLALCGTIADADRRVSAVAAIHADGEGD